MNMATICAQETKECRWKCVRLARDVVSNSLLNNVGGFAVYVNNKYFSIC